MFAEVLLEARLGLRSSASLDSVDTQIESDGSCAEVSLSLNRQVLGLTLGLLWDFCRENKKQNNKYDLTIVN